VTFDEARQCVLREVRPCRGQVEQVPLLDAAERVLAEAVPADRDYPPFDRSTRDGFAVRASDVPGELLVVAEVRAGEKFDGEVTAGQTVEIMTGAPLPRGANAVVMVEHIEPRHSGAVTVKISRSINPGENFVPSGSEAKGGDTILRPGGKLGFAEIGVLAMVGRQIVQVFKRPSVAILPTGDEIIEASETPLPHQIRNSNSWSLAVQVRRAGGMPEVLPIARDSYESTRASIERGLQSDLLLLSGGVSAGKYDIVEKVLADLGAKFFFTRVLIQPGQPLVFGAVGEKLFFGLPGNPASTMVTFELFARAAIERLSGLEHPTLPLLHTKLSRDFHHKTGLTRFLPARLSEDGSTIEPLGWQGSGDISAVSRANAFLVAESDRESWNAGDDIRVLLK
jgi:molybdopterin molybdotransferase